MENFSNELTDYSKEYYEFIDLLKYIRDYLNNNKKSLFIIYSNNNRPILFNKIIIRSENYSGFTRLDNFPTSFRVYLKHKLKRIFQIDLQYFKFKILQIK